MSAADVDIEQIVRRVLQQLAQPVGGQNVGAQASACKSEGSLKAELQQSELLLCEPVVTLAQLNGRLEGVKTVVVNRTAVVTPSARDLLKQHGITITRKTGSARVAAGDVVVAAAETDYDAAGLTRMLTQQGINTERLAQCGLLAAIDELTDMVAHGGKVGVLLTRQTAAALCLANRTRGVQAVQAGSVEAVRSARTAFGANLLVVDPRGRGLHELAGMIRTCATMAANYLENFKQRLI